MLSKPVFAHRLSTHFKITAKWRGNNALRYSFDHRNADSQKRLLDLESQIHVSDENWERIAPLVQDYETCLAAINETNRLVGFKEVPADFPAWFELFCIILSRYCSVAG